jgi:archaeosine-15-forming tRNA-guanine transglycosylase
VLCKTSGPECIFPVHGKVAFVSSPSKATCTIRCSKDGAFFSLQSASLLHTAKVLRRVSVFQHEAEKMCRGNLCFLAFAVSFLYTVNIRSPIVFLGLESES